MDETDDYLEEEAEAEGATEEMSVGQMLGRHGTSEGGEEEDGYGYDEEDY